MVNCTLEWKNILFGYPSMKKDCLYDYARVQFYHPREDDLMVNETRVEVLSQWFSITEKSLKYAFVNKRVFYTKSLA